MKFILFVIVMTIANIQLFAQTASSQRVSDVYLYVDGIRLDSVPSMYAEFYWLVGKIAFDYGQDTGKHKFSLLTDKDGNPLVFDRHSDVKLLDILYFNHWEFKQVYYLADLGYYILQKNEELSSR